jgi:choline-phosphate cytidylyltransferase
LLAIFKLLGANYKEVSFYSYNCLDKHIDLFTKIIIHYNNAIATANIGLGVKSEGDLTISGTDGYIYVPSPWWKTEYFEIRYEDSSNSQKYFYKFAGDGLRYEIAEFIFLINQQKHESYKLTSSESMSIHKVIEQYLARINISYI